MIFPFLILTLLIHTLHAAPLTKSAVNPTLLISLDGFKADKLDQFLSENPSSIFQTEFVNRGVKAEDGMTPSFPSLTFSNHFTIVTGLYPESQGIVGNKVYDPDYDDKVNFLEYNGKDKFDPKWWNTCK